jgi:cytochrome c
LESASSADTDVWTRFKVKALKRGCPLRQTGWRVAPASGQPGRFESRNLLQRLYTMKRRFKMKSGIAIGSVLVLAIAATSYSGASFAFDEAAAKALAKKNDCTKCHAVDKEKKGPAYKKIAAKYKGKADGEQKVIKNMTVVSKVKLTDGTEEDHKVIDTKDEKEIKNIAQWILAQ